jgi:hypothetical protein
MPGRSDLGRQTSAFPSPAALPRTHALSHLSCIRANLPLFSQRGVLAKPFLKISNCSTEESVQVSSFLCPVSLRQSLVFFYYASNAAAVNRGATSDVPNPYQLPNVGFSLSKFLLGEVRIDLCKETIFCPIPSSLCYLIHVEELPIDVGLWAEATLQVFLITAKLSNSIINR